MWHSQGNAPSKPPLAGPAEVERRAEEAQHPGGLVHWDDEGDDFWGAAQVQLWTKGCVHGGVASPGC